MDAMIFVLKLLRYVLLGFSMDSWVLDLDP